MCASQDSSFNVCISRQFISTTRDSKFTQPARITQKRVQLLHDPNSPHSGALRRAGGVYCAVRSRLAIGGLFIWMDDAILRSFLAFFMRQKSCNEQDIATKHPVTAIMDASNASRSILRPSFISVYFILTLKRSLQNVLRILKFTHAPQKKQNKHSTAS